MRSSDCGRGAVGGEAGGAARTHSPRAAAHLGVEEEEALRAVGVVEGREGRHGRLVARQRVQAQLAARAQQHEVRRGPAHEHAVVAAHVACAVCVPSVTSTSTRIGTKDRMSKQSVFLRSTNQTLKT